MTALDLALQYADRGWPVFPCGPADKAPLVPTGFKAATTDAAQVRDWWTRHPDAMIGVPTGQRSGVWVLDVDVKHGDGHAELAALEAEHGALPNTIASDTPSGGRHMLFEFVDGVRNRAKVSANIDVRGEGGYIIAPGSVNSDGQFYEWGERAPQPAKAPAWLLAKVIKRGAAVEALPAASKPNTRYVEAAIADELSKLTRTARGRNNALNDAAFALGTFVGAGALSNAEAESRLFGAAMANGYVAKDGSDAAWQTIRSGLASGSAKPRAIPEAPPDVDETLAAEGAAIAAALTASIEVEAAEQARAFGATPFVWTEPKRIPRRQWIYGQHYIRRYLSLTVAAGGAGKSSLAIAEALAMVKGWPLLGDTAYEDPKISARVWYYNGEDDRDELTRRIIAACLYHKIEPNQLDGRLFVDSGREHRLITHRLVGKDIRIASPIIDAVKRAIIENRIDVFIVDPFVSTHGVPENDNGAIEQVADLWRQIAGECNCSVELIHHTKKTEAGRPVTATDARGAGALVNAARSVRELNNMSEEQGEAAGVSAEERNAIKALTFGKNNLGPMPAFPRWKKIVDVELANDTGIGEGQDRVGVVTGWEWPSAEKLLDEVSAEELKAIKERIGAGNWSEHSQSGKRWAGHVVAEVLGMNADSPVAQKRIRRMLTAWIKAGEFGEKEVKDRSTNYQSKQFLEPIW